MSLLGQETRGGGSNPNACWRLLIRQRQAGGGSAEPAGGCGIEAGRSLKGQAWSSGARLSTPERPQTHTSPLPVWQMSAAVTCWRDSRAQVEPPLHSSHPNLPESPPPPTSHKNDEVFFPCPYFSLPGCYPNPTTCPCQPLPHASMSSTSYLSPFCLSTVSLSLSSQLWPSLHVLVFAPLPHCSGWGGPHGITISSEGLSALPALPLCPHS